MEVLFIVIELELIAVLALQACILFVVCRKRQAAVPSRQAEAWVPSQPDPDTPTVPVAAAPRGAQTVPLAPVVVETQDKLKQARMRSARVQLKPIARTLMTGAHRIVRTEEIPKQQR